MKVSASRSWLLITQCSSRQLGTKRIAKDEACKKAQRCSSSKFPMHIGKNQSEICAHRQGPNHSYMGGAWDT